jgi:hypothetical protein
MQALNLPEAEFRIRDLGGKKEIFDSIRKKYIALTPEEWVRQNFISYLIRQKNIPPSLIGIEVSLKLNGLRKRSDILVYNRSGKPVLIVECKAPEVPVTQEVFEQVARYNMTWKVNWLVVTNGMVHFACYIDHEKSEFRFLKEIPDFSEIQ